MTFLKMHKPIEIRFSSCRFNFEYESKKLPHYICMIFIQTIGNLDNVLDMEYCLHVAEFAVNFMICNLT